MKTYIDEELKEQITDEVLKEVKSRLKFEVGLTLSIEREGWGADYTEGYADGIQRAIELLKEV